ncbi:ribbon-helix-helix protein, CopG family [Termitidicoccus mucosus]
MNFDVARNTVMAPFLHGPATRITCLLNPSAQITSTMTKKKSTVSAPLTFDLPLSLIEKLGTIQKKAGLGSASETVREAIDQFDFERYASSNEEHRQISVRLPVELKAKLAKYAKKKKTSVGALLREALGAFEAKSAKKGGRK